MEPSKTGPYFWSPEVLPTTFPLRMHTHLGGCKMDPPLIMILSRYPRDIPILRTGMNVFFFLGLCDPSLAGTNITRRTCKNLRVDDAMHHNIGQ